MIYARKKRKKTRGGLADTTAKEQRKRSREEELFFLPIFWYCVREEKIVILRCVKKRSIDRVCIDKQS